MGTTQEEVEIAGLTAASGEKTFALAARRTGMAFQRTRMAAERTLMAVIRTALSLIGFGFTIYQFFRHLQDAKVLSARSHDPFDFAVSLVALGLGMLAIGMSYHVYYMLDLRKMRERMTEDGLVYGKSPYPVSMTLMIAMLLFLLGVTLIVSMVFHIGPLS